MTTLMQASHQWATRPSDERYTSLTAMLDHFQHQRDNSRALVVSTRRIDAIPQADHKGLTIEVETETQGKVSVFPSNWAFGQLAQLAEAPASYLRTVPAEIAADCINYGLQFKRDIEDVGVLMYRNGGDPILRAATGPRYGRIWNLDIVKALVSRFGDGLTGQFRVPGEFGKAVTVTKANTTLYAGDRNMFVFLADEVNRIEIPNRRDGKTGQLARGFFVWNSEVGSETFGVSTFLFDYVCCNRMVWGAEQIAEITIRHTASAPDKFAERIEPALIEYSNSSTASITQAVANAQKARIDNVDEFLAKRFGKRMVNTIKQAHVTDEQRPIETIWDATTAVTAYARNVEWQDRRVELETQAGDMMKLAA